MSREMDWPKIERIGGSLKDQAINLLKKNYKIWLEQNIAKESLEKGGSYKRTSIEKLEDGSFEVISGVYSREGEKPTAKNEGEGVETSLEVHWEKEGAAETSCLRNISEVERFIEKSFPNAEIIDVTKETIKYSQK